MQPEGNCRRWRQQQLRPFFILITAILAVFIVISAHVYLGSGLFAGLFTFTIYYLAWELTIWRLRAIPAV